MSKGSVSLKLKDFQNIIKIQNEIEVYRIRIRRARESAEKITPSYSFAPGGSFGSKVENAAVDVVYYEQLIAQRTRELFILRAQLLAVIRSCDDPIVRAALSLRFDIVPGQIQPTWVQVASAIGSSADCVRMACVRFLEKI